MIKQALLCAALVASAGAHASFTVTPGSAKTFSGYDGQPALETGTLSAGIQGLLAGSGPGTVSFTYLGNESANVNQFTFSVGSQTLNESDAVGKTISGSIASAINFSFRDLSTGTTFSNGSDAIVYVADVGTVHYGKFDYIIGLNDNGSRDGDFDDFVIGARFVAAPIPEPQTYALLAAGLAAVSFVARRRRD